MKIAPPGALGPELYDFGKFLEARRFLMFFRPTRSEAKMRKTPPGTTMGVLGNAIGVPGCRPRPGSWLKTNVLSVSDVWLVPGKEYYARCHWCTTCCSLHSVHIICATNINQIHEG